MISKAKTVKEYLAELPAERRAALAAVRRVMRKNLDPAYEEGILYGMIAYFVPHRLYPAGYHCDPTKPVMFAALGNQKNYMSVYLMCLYGSKEHADWFQAEWAKTGKPLDMGKSCVRFSQLDDLALDVLGMAVARVPAATYIANYQAALQARPKRSRAGKKVR